MVGSLLACLLLPSMFRSGQVCNQMPSLPMCFLPLPILPTEFHCWEAVQLRGDR